MEFHTTGRIEKMRLPRKDIKTESRACGFSSILMISAVLIRPIERQQKMTAFCPGNYPSLKLTRLSFSFSRTDEIFLQTADGLPHCQKKIDEFERPVHFLILTKIF